MYFNGDSLWLTLNVDAGNAGAQQTLLDVTTQHLIFV
jgi:hypothetical protein